MGCYFLLQGDLSVPGLNHVSCGSHIGRQILYYCTTWEVVELNSILFKYGLDIVMCL